MGAIVLCIPLMATLLGVVPRESWFVVILVVSGTLWVNSIMLLGHLLTTRQLARKSDLVCPRCKTCLIGRAGESALANGTCFKCGYHVMREDTQPPDGSDAASKSEGNASGDE